MTLSDPLYGTPLTLAPETEAWLQGRSDAKAGKQMQCHPHWPGRFDYEDGYAEALEEMEGEHV